MTLFVVFFAVLILKMLQHRLSLQSVTAEAVSVASEKTLQRDRAMLRVS